MSGTVTAIGTATDDHLAALLRQLEVWQDLPDTAHIVTSLAAAVVAEDCDARPVWLLVVAPPSSGKTEAVRLLGDVAAEHIDEVSIGGLLTWAKRGKRPVPSGLLTRVTDGLITFGDLSTLLATSDRGGRDQVFAALRRVYDGELTRDIAPPGAAETTETLSWSGCLTIIGAVTGAIDGYSAHADALGSRWLYCRIPDRGLDARRRAARRNRGRDLKGQRARARALAATVVRVARRHLPDVVVSDELADAIDDAAIACAYGRGSVPRNGYGRREIEGAAEVEDPGRLVGVLLNLARGLLALGLDEDAALRLCRRTALDSMPAVRSAVLRVLAGQDAGVVVSTSDVAGLAGLDRGVARRALEDLAAIGVAVADRDGNEPPEGEPDKRPCRWSLLGREGELIRKVVDCATCSEKWGHHTTTPQDQKREKTPRPAESGGGPHVSEHALSEVVTDETGTGRGTAGRSQASPDVVLRIATEKAAGRSTRVIAAGLMADGIPTPTGKARWYSASVQSVLTTRAGTDALAAVQGAAS